MQTNDPHAMIPQGSLRRQSTRRPTARLLTSLRKFFDHLNPTSRAVLQLLLILLVGYLALVPIFPRRVIPASASPELFSAERALVHLPAIAREIHRNGTPAQARVRDYLVQQLGDLGLEVHVQQASGIENVVARIPGTDPTGAVLILAHYDSYGGPGAADNGSGVSALLEIMRSLSIGSPPRNDIIALFDDGEEMPDPITGTKAFVREHPWMDSVKVAIGMDTAARGFISVVDTGPQNGWLVRVLSRAYTGGVWSSLAGGGEYDTQPFRDAGVRVLELEDNYPFHQQHTPDDLPAIVNPGTLQQLGEQALSVTHELQSLDLSQTSGVQRTYHYMPFFGLLHYPQSWALPFAILAGVLIITAFVLALWSKLANWRGFGVALLTILVSAALAAVVTNLIWQAAPDWFDWPTRRWSEWPEVIPPNGWLVFLLCNALVLILCAVAFRLARRWSAAVHFSLIGLFLLLLPTLATGVAAQSYAILLTWPVLLGGVFWSIAALLHHKNKSFAENFGTVFSAIPILFYIFPLPPVIFMSDGTKSVAIMAGVWAILLGIILPAMDGLLVPASGHLARTPHPRFHEVNL